MPNEPRNKPCAWPGCGALVSGRHCRKHAKMRRQAEDARRGKTAERGYGSKWRRARAAYLKANPLCRACQSRGVLTAATVVDHVTPHRGDAMLMWSPANWQPLCKPCHDSKTATEQARGRGG